MVKATTPAMFELETDRTPTREGPLPFSERLVVTQELLNALKDATRPGQAHLMQRALNILQCELLSPSLSLSEDQATDVVAAVAELEHEAARTAPDTAMFGSRAQMVLDLLSRAQAAVVRGTP